MQEDDERPVDAIREHTNKHSFYLLDALSLSGSPDSHSQLKIFRLALGFSVLFLLLLLRFIISAPSKGNKVVVAIVPPPPALPV